MIVEWFITFVFMNLDTYLKKYIIVAKHSVILLFVLWKRLERAMFFTLVAAVGSKISAP